MAISWYPHHMFHALKDIEKYKKIIDYYFYMIDARAPITSLNKEFLVKYSNVIFLINKCDLVSKRDIKRIKDYFLKYNKPIFSIVAKDENNIKNLLKNIKKNYNKKRMYFIVVGLPNVGKSMFIRTVTKSKIKIGARAGITKKLEWLSAKNGYFFADTPGILWPSIDNDIIYYKLILINAIGDKMSDFDKTADWFYEYINKNNNYFEIIKKKYKIKNDNRLKKMLVNSYRKGYLKNIILDEI